MAKKESLADIVAREKAKAGTVDAPQNHWDRDLVDLGLKKQPKKDD
jgi:hypothetical protein